MKSLSYSVICTPPCTFFHRFVNFSMFMIHFYRYFYDPPLLESFVSNTFKLMIRSTILFVFIVFNFTVNAQQVFHFKDLRLEFCTSVMFRVSKGPELKEPWMVDRYTWDSVHIDVTTSDKQIILQTSALRLIIRKPSLNIDVYTLDGRLLSAETASDTLSCHKLLQPDEHFFGFGERMDFLD